MNWDSVNNRGRPTTDSKKVAEAWNKFVALGNNKNMPEDALRDIFDSVLAHERLHLKKCIARRATSSANEWPSLNARNQEEAEAVAAEIDVMEQCMKEEQCDR